MMRQPTNTRNFIVSNSHRQPLAGKDSAGVSKTLAESECRQQHPRFLRKRGLWEKVEPSLRVKRGSVPYKGNRRGRKDY